MKGKYFLDTNILVYTFDTKTPKKQKTAQFLLNKALTERAGVISYQVVQEFLNVSTKKFAVPLKIVDAKIYLDQVLAPLCEIYPSPELYSFALDIQAEAKFSFYDSLIIASAIKTGCKTLYTEDLHNGQSLFSLTIQNPFEDGSKQT